MTFWSSASVVQNPDWNFLVTTLGQFSGPECSAPIIGTELGSVASWGDVTTITNNTWADIPATLSYYISGPASAAIAGVPVGGTL